MDPPKPLDRTREDFHPPDAIPQIDGTALGLQPWRGVGPSRQGQHGKDEADPGKVFTLLYLVRYLLLQKIKNKKVRHSVGTFVPVGCKIFPFF